MLRLSVDRPQPGRRRGFTLIELLVVVAVIALLLSFVIPAFNSARRAARLTQSLANLRTIGQSAFAYAADSQDAIAALWWTAEFAEESGGLPDQFSSTVPGDAAAQRNQIASIARARLGAQVITPPDGYFARGPTSTQHHLVLLDYWGEQGRVDEIAMDPADEFLLQFVGDGQRFDDDAGLATAYYNLPIPGYFTMLSSSYTLVPAAVTDDQSPGLAPYHEVNVMLVTEREQNSRYHRTRRHTEVRFPAQKVWYMQDVQLHFPGKLPYADEEARTPLMMFDGSVSVRASGDSNPGYNPDRPTVTGNGVRMPLIRGFPGDTMNGDRVEDTALSNFPFYFPRYRWTRGGLRGVDFGADEVRFAY